jgi:hypothetical protein
MDTPKNENSESETISASQAAILDSGAKPEGGVTAWCTVAGGYVIILHVTALLHDFCEGGWHFSRPSDTYHRSECTRICMFWLGLRPLSMSAGLDQRSSGFSLPWAFLPGASLTKDISSILFLLVPSFTFSGSFYQHYPIASFSTKMQSFHAFFGTC